VKRVKTVINARMAKLEVIEKIPVKKFDGADTFNYCK